MKRSVVLTAVLLFVVLACAAWAQEAELVDYNDYELLDMKFTLDSGFEFSGRGGLDYVRANLSFAPILSSHQQVLNLKTYSNPSARVVQDEGIVAYEWGREASRRFSFGIESDIRNKNYVVPVYDKVKFPLTGIRSVFTQPSEYIDINDGIRKKANELSAGEDDLYAVVYNVARWVEGNINYDLKSAGASVVEKSSWVFENKKGVCDEMTNLFISMLRSLGIPARFVTGVAFSNINNEWGPHAWAEVYFPDGKWVPFDITYGQLGWVDPTHVKLKHSVDSGDPTVKYFWMSDGLSFKSEPVNMKTKLIQTSGNRLGSFVDFKVNALIDDAAPGSYVPFEVVVRNNKMYEGKHFYFIDTLIVKKAQKLLDKNYQRILLKPGETKKAYWIMKIPDEVEKGYNYRSVIEVEDIFHSNSITNITYGAGGKYVSLEDAENMIGGLERENLRVYSKVLDLNCSSPSYLYKGELVGISCSVGNIGESNLGNVEVCLDGQCEFASLNAGENKIVQFSLDSSSWAVGRDNFRITAEALGESCQDVVSLDVRAPLILSVSGVSYPKIVGYGEGFQMIFDISILEDYVVSDVEVWLSNEKKLDIGTVSSTQRIVLKGLKGKQFVSDKKINLVIKYNKDGNEMEFVQSYPIGIKSIPWYVHLLRWLGVYRF